MRNRFLLLAPLVAVSATTLPTSQPSTRPTVFRCVLDGNARMIVCSLGDGVYAAYDANRCSLAKLWRGEVILTGPVYDTRHGPQPKSAGTQLIDRPATLAPTPAAPATQPTDYANVNGYRGYAVRDGRPTMQFDFDGVAVDETPSLVSSDAGQIVVRRTLAVGGAVTADRPFAVDVPTSAAVRRVRVVAGEATLAGKPVAAGADVAFDAAANVALQLAGPGTITIDTTFATE